MAGVDTQTGRERILTALAVRPPDRVPLYIHGINEGPIIGIGRHLTDGLPAPRQFHEMSDAEKFKLVDTLFLIHEAFGVDGVTTFEIGHERELDALHVMDDWGVTYRRSPHGLPVAKGHPIGGAGDLARFRLCLPGPLLLPEAVERGLQVPAPVLLLQAEKPGKYRLAYGVWRVGVFQVGQHHHA